MQTLLANNDPITNFHIPNFKFSITIHFNTREISVKNRAPSEIMAANRMGFVWKRDRFTDTRPKQSTWQQTVCNRRLRRSNRTLRQCHRKTWLQSGGRRFAITAILLSYEVIRLFLASYSFYSFKNPQILTKQGAKHTIYSKTMTLLSKISQSSTFCIPSQHNTQQNI